MSEHVFGKPLSRTFIAYENDVAIPISSINSVTLHSSLDHAVAALSPIASMSSWTANSLSPFEVTYDLPAVSDPSPSATRRSWQLWEAVKYKLSASGDVQTEYRAIDISKATSGESLPGTTATDLKALFPALSAYLSDSKISDILDLAGIEMKMDLKSKGIDYSKARNLQTTKLALAYLAVAMSAEGLYSRTGQDVHYQRGKDYRQHYSKTLSKVSLPYDSDGDGVPDETKQAQPAFWYMPR